MTIDVASELGREALVVTIMAALPAMLAGLVTGLVVSLVQSITSVQEQTLSFVPKIIITLLVVVLALPIILQDVVDYTRDLFMSIPGRL